jgi:hypothetical protein
MATKREVMLAGTAAKLAHMLASDQPTVVTPTGTDQASATLLEANFVILEGATAASQGVRLPPATGQYLHALRNATGLPVNVYPSGTEHFGPSDVGLEGVPFLLNATATGLFLPSRRQWLGIQGSGGGLISFTGPVGIGEVPPADAAAGDLFADFYGLRFQSVAGGAALGRLGVNSYLDQTGTWRYLADGPAMSFVCRPNTEDWEFRWVAPGTAGAPIANPGLPGGWITALLIGPALALQPEPAGGVTLARFGFNAYLDPTGQWRYIVAGPAWSMVGRVSNSALEFRTMPSGAADGPINNAETAGGWVTSLGVLAPAANGQTAMQLRYTDTAGVQHYQQVMVSAANAVAGLPAGARALYVIP